MASDLILLLIILDMTVDRTEMWRCAFGAHASRKTRRRMTPSFEMLVVLERPLHVSTERKSEFWLAR